jgi:hypothetical protein
MAMQTRERDPEKLAALPRRIEENLQELAAA